MKKLQSNSILSVQLVKNSLRRLLPLIIASIAMCFISLTLPSMLLSNEYNDLLYYYDEVDYAKLIGTFLGVITPILLFASIHKKNSVNFHFSLPLTRTQVFISYFVVSILILAVPLLYIFVQLSIVASVKIAIKCVLYGIVTGLFTMAISTFAGVLTGNTIIHLVVAIWLNFIAPTFILIANVYGQLFFRGFPGIIDDFILKLSPVTYDFQLKSIYPVVYMLIAIVLLIVSVVLFKKLKLERSEHGVTYKVAGIIFNIILSIYGGAMLGTLIYELNENVLEFLIGCTLGSIFVSFAAYMFFNKSSKIFSKKSVRVMVVSLVISLLFAGSFIIDVYKYNDRVPAVSEVKKVTVDLGLSNHYTYHIYNDSKLQFSDNLNKQRIISMHSDIVADPNLENVKDGGDYDYIYMEYQLNNGKKIVRNYMVVLNDKKYFKDLMESEEYKDQQKLSNNLSEYDNMVIYDYFGNIVFQTVAKDNFNKVAKALNKDIDNRNFEDYSINEKYLYNIELSGEDNKYVNVHVYKGDKNAEEIIKNISGRLRIIN